MKRRVAICRGREAVADFVGGGGGGCQFVSWIRVKIISVDFPNIE